MIILRLIPLRIVNISDKHVTEYQNTYFIFNNFFSRNFTVCEMMWKKYGTARRATGDNIIRRKGFAFWIHKATNTHSEYIILLFALQQWLHERALVLHYTYIVCVVSRNGTITKLWRKINVFTVSDCPFVSFYTDLFVWCLQSK